MKIAALLLDSPNANKRAARKNQHFEGFSYTGFRRVIRDCEKKYPVEYCSPSDMHKYDYVLCSLHSNKEVENLVYTFDKYNIDKKKCKFVIGGAGIINIKLYSDYLDVVCFGRGENQILDILEGKEASNIWRKEDDPDFKKEYSIRQAVEIIEDEAPTVGCLNKCSFCQYTYVRKPFNYDKVKDMHYSSAKDRLSPASVEDDWKHLQVKDGRNHTTALDGFSEATRVVVGKRVSDDDIKQKIEEIYAQGIMKDMHVKVYAIVGYPWEDWNTVVRDINHLSKVIAEADRPKKQMMLRFFFQVTPFMAEPLTPMQYMKSSIDINWHNLSLYYPKSKFYVGRNIEAIIYPYIPSPFTILKRQYVNRGTKEDLANFKKLIFTKKLSASKVDTSMYAIKKSGLMPERIIGHTTKEEIPFNYIKTYIDVNKAASVVTKKAKELCKTGLYKWQN